MRDRLLCAFLLLAFSAFPVFGQGGFTTVSGAIVDPNGIPWTGGTISAQFITPGGTTPTLNGQPFTSTTASGLLGPGGTFTMRLGDNGVIACPTSPCGTWQFTSNIAPGVLPPLGKGPQSFVVTTAINCGTNTPATCTSNAMNITTALTPVPALTNLASSFPAGQTPVTKAIYAADPLFGVTTGGFVGDAVTNSTTTITSASANFLTNGIKVGQHIFSTNSGGASTGPLSTPYTTVASIVNNTTITVVSASTLTGSNQILLWGDDDTTALTNFVSAVQNSGPLTCGVLPSGIMFTTKAQMLDGRAFHPNFDCFTAGGPGYSIIVPVPGFDFTTCNVASTCFMEDQNHAAYMMPNYDVYENIAIWGGGNNLAGINTGTVNVVSFNAVMVRNIWLWMWGGSNTGTMKAFSLTGPTVAWDLVEFGVGQEQNSSANATPGSTTVSNSFFNQFSVIGFFDSQNNQYGVGSPGTLVTVNSGSTFNSFGDEFFGGTFVINDAGGRVNLSGGYVYTAQLSGEAFLLQTGSHGYATGTTFTASGGSGVAIDRQGTAIYQDGQNNIITVGIASSIVPSCAMTTGGGTGPACALVAGSYNEKGTIRMTPGTTPGATGTTTLTFAGTFTGMTGTAPSCTFNYANTGTGTWSLTTTTPIVLTTRSSTAPVFNWNQTGALTAASTYDIDYVCQAR